MWPRMFVKTNHLSWAMSDHSEHEPPLGQPRLGAAGLLARVLGEQKSSGSTHTHPSFSARLSGSNNRKSACNSHHLPLSQFYAIIPRINVSPEAEPTSGKALHSTADRQMHGTRLREPSSSNYFFRTNRLCQDLKSSHAPSSISLRCLLTLKPFRLCLRL